MLTTLPQLKAHLNIDPAVTAQDPWLTALLSSADALAKEYMGRAIEAANYVEFYQGTGQRTLALVQRPVLQINNLWQDFAANYGQAPGAFASNTLLTQGKDYVLDYGNGGTASRSGLVIRLGGVWSEVGRTYYVGKLSAEIGPSFGCIKVDYRAGYTTIPPDLQYAVAYLVAYMRRTIKLGAPVTEERIGDYQYEIMKNVHVNDRDPDLSSARQILSRYRESAW